MKVTLVIVTVFVLGALASKEDATADILKNLQDSGVIGSVKEELEKMLQDTDKMNEIKDTILEKEEELRAKISQQLSGKASTEKAKKKEDQKNVKNEVLDYAMSFAEETNLELSKDVIKHVGQIPVKGEKITLHFVQLAKVLEKLAETVKKGDLRENDVLANKFKSLQDLKDLITSSAESKKQREAELAEENIGNKKEQAKEQSKRGTQMAEAVRTFAKMAGNNPDMLVNAVLMGMSSYNLAAPETIQMLRGYSHSFTKIEGLGDVIVGFAENVAWLLESEEGEMFFEIVPMLLEEEKRDEGYELLRIETKKQWSKFFAIIKNTDMRRKFLVQMADYLTFTYRLVVKDQMKMMVANAFLISQGLPTIQPRNLADSLIDLLDRSIHLFTTYKLEFSEYKKTVKAFIKQVESEYVTVEMFDKLEDSEQAELVSQFFDDNVVSLGQDIFQSHNLVYSQFQVDCAESILCEINEHVARTSDPNGIKAKVAHGLTTVFGYVWSTITDDLNSDIYFLKAVKMGSDPDVKCSTLYPNPECKIFDWQNEDIMSLDFEHTEL